MNYLLWHKRTRAGLLRALGGATVAVVAIFFLQWLAPHMLAPFAVRIAEPFFFVEASISSAGEGISAFFRSRAGLASENAALKEALADARAENEFMKAISAVQKDGAVFSGVGENTIIASILSRPRWSAYDTLIIGAGVAGGVEVGMRAFASGFVIGEVVEVGSRTASVFLYSTPDRKVVAQIAGKFPTELAGSGGGTFEAIVPRGLPVSVGDGAFAHDISPKLFAIVDAVAESGEGTAKIYLRLPINIFELRTVEVGM
ncbi:MAG: hypothetical protein A3C08_00150 [Candidatus Taylorbacteria bacterium RIFCSPHIGHO2_02_FULL_47_18]|nr:MAG: hypothetical protein A3C08_00150 [Candidatus Taylorbacteria bacterium RIFCSPHIGHO2_02_FULL_47_18]